MILFAVNGTSSEIMQTPLALEHHASVTLELARKSIVKSKLQLAFDAIDNGSYEHLAFPLMVETQLPSTQPEKNNERNQPLWQHCKGKWDCLRSARKSRLSCWVLWPPFTVLQSYAH